MLETLIKIWKVGTGDITWMAHHIKQQGYDMALKSWADGKPKPGFMLMLWKPNQVKDTSMTFNGENPVKLFWQAFDACQAKE